MQSSHNKHQDLQYETDLEAGESRNLISKQQQPQTDDDIDRRPVDVVKEAEEKKDGATVTTQIKFLCFNLSLLSPTLRFILLTVGVNFFFLLNSCVEEYIFKQLHDFSYGWYLTFFELACFAVFAVIERAVMRDEQLFEHRAAISRHFLVAVAMTASRGLTNVSLQYLNYPTQVIFKSMKLLTVMIGSLVLLKAHFAFYEYTSALLLVLSACLFSLGDVDVQPDYNLTGLIIVSLSLIADALHSNSQDALLRYYQASTSETMLFTNLFAAILTLNYCTLSGELLPALRYCTAMTYVLFIVRALVIYFGVLCFVTLIQAFGVVAATSITTVRKILTILLSFFVYPKAFSDKYAYGVVIFVASVVVGVWGKEREKKAKLTNKSKGEYSVLPTQAEKDNATSRVNGESATVRRAG